MRRSRVQFSHFRVQLYPKLHEKACNHIYFIKCSLIFQDSYMRSGDMTTFLGLFQATLTTFVITRLRSYVLLMLPLFK